MSRPRRASSTTAPRKLLVAAIGVATINYVGCKKINETSGNLPTAEGMQMEREKERIAASDGATEPRRFGGSPEMRDAAVDAKIIDVLTGPVIDGSLEQLPPTTGNLPAPPADGGGIRLRGK